MYELHSRQIIHRDIKPSNILVFNEEISDHIEVKISDYDFCTSLKRNDLTMTGTQSYMSPEMKDMRPYSLKTDIFSLGMTMMEIITGYILDYSEILTQ